MRNGGKARRMQRSIGTCTRRRCGVGGSGGTDIRPRPLVRRGNRCSCRRGVAAGLTALSAWRRTLSRRSTERSAPFRFGTPPAKRLAARGPRSRGVQRLDKDALRAWRSTRLVATLPRGVSQIASEGRRLCFRGDLGTMHNYHVAKPRPHFAFSRSSGSGIETYEQYPPLFEPKSSYPHTRTGP